MSHRSWNQYIVPASLALALVSPEFANAESVTAAVNKALVSNPSLLAQRAARKIAGEGYIQARSGYGPTLTFSAAQRETSGQVHRTDLPPIDYSGGSHDVTLRLNQPLYTGGRVRADVSAAGARVQLSNETLREAEEQLISDVISAYVAVNRSQKLVALAMNQRQTLQDEQDTIEVRLRAGEATLIDRAQIAARIAEANTRVARVNSQLANDRAGYAAAVGEPPTATEEPLEIVELPATLDEALVVAARNSPALAAAQYAVDAARAALTREKANRMPTVALTATAGDQPLSTTDPSLFARQTTVAVNFNLPLLTSGLTTSNIREAEFELERRAYLEQNERRVLTESVTRAWNNRAAARRVIIATSQQVAAAEAISEAVREGRDAGTHTVQNVLEADEDLWTAQTAQVTASTQAYLSDVEIIRLIGLLYRVVLDRQIHE